MPQAEYSTHVAVEVQDDLIHRGQHDVHTPGRMSISVIEVIAEALDVDPMECNLELDQFIEPGIIDELAEQPVHFDEDDNDCVGLTFDYGDYNVFCCSCGKVAVYAPLEAHIHGELDAPCFESEPTHEDSLEDRDGDTPMMINPATTMIVSLPLILKRILVSSWKHESGWHLCHQIASHLLHLVPNLA